AVTAADLAGQFHQNTAGQPPVVSAIYRWDPTTGGYSAVPPSQAVPAGAVLWVRARTNATLGIVGTYNDPVNRPMPAGSHYLASAGLETVPVLGQGAGLRADVVLSQFDAFGQGWHQHLP